MEEIKFCCGSMEQAKTWGLVHRGTMEKWGGLFIGTFKYDSPDLTEAFMYLDYCPWCKKKLDGGKK